MKTKIFICLLVVFLGAAQASAHMKHHSSKLDHKQELLQTASTVTTSTETAAEAGAEAECDPECLYKFPYVDSKCATTREPVEPVPHVEEGETFVLEAEGCYTFEVTPEPVPEPPVEETETFVVDAEGCYDFTEGQGELEPIIRIEECFDEEEPIIPPPPGPEESCDEPSHVYIYPFINPNGDCKVEEETESITVVNQDVPPGGEIIETVDEDGESHTTFIDANGEVLNPLEPTEEVSESSDEGGYGIPTGDEHGETRNPFEPTEDVDESSGEGGYGIPTGDEHGETRNPFEPTEDVDESSGEGGYGIPTGDEHGETRNPFEPTEDVDESSGEGGYTFESDSDETIAPPFIEETSDETPEVTVVIPFDETDYEEHIEWTGEACYVFGEEESGEITVRVEESDHEEPIPHDEETDITDDESECVIGDTYSFGTTIIYEQPCTYINYYKWDEDKSRHVTYTYVLTNVYSGIFKTNEYHYVIYGAGAVNFYNNYYGIDARQHDAPSCSCTCGYQTYTFTYSFGF